YAVSRKRSQGAANCALAVRTGNRMGRGSRPQPRVCAVITRAGTALVHGLLLPECVTRKVVAHAFRQEKPDGSEGRARTPCARRMDAAVGDRPLRRPDAP